MKTEELNINAFMFGLLISLFGFFGMFLAIKGNYLYSLLSLIIAFQSYSIFLKELEGEK